MNLLQGFFLKRKFVCPFCLRRVPWRKELKTCPHDGCGKELPVRYVHQDMLLRPFPVQVMGWAQHGKTTYLYGMTLTLMKLNKIWPHFSWSAATESTQEMVQKIIASTRQGRMPNPTPMGADECHVMMLPGMEPWGGRALLLRDCPGEVFRGMAIPVEHAPFLLRSRTVFMFVSLPDLFDETRNTDVTRQRTMSMLMENYVDTLARRGIPFLRQRRNVVVVLTKADRLRELPAQLRDYLARDTLWAAVSAPSSAQALGISPGVSRDEASKRFMERYLTSMERIDRVIREWIEESETGWNFLRLAEQNRIHLRFSLTSATGAQVSEGNTMAAVWEPRRVLDPFFWGLELERQGSSWVRFISLSRSILATLSRWFDRLTNRTHRRTSPKARGSRQPL